MEDQKDIDSKQEQQESVPTAALEKQQEEVPASADGQARVPRDRNVTPQVSKVYPSPWLSRSREDTEAELHQRQQQQQQQQIPAVDDNKAKESPMSWVAQRVLSTGWLSASRNRPRDEAGDHPRGVDVDQAGGAQAWPEAPEHTQEPPQPTRILSTGWLSLGRKHGNPAPLQDQDQSSEQRSRQPLQSPVRNWISSGWFNLGTRGERTDADQSDASQ